MSGRLRKASLNIFGKVRLDGAATMPFGVLFRVSQLNDSVLYAENVFQFPGVILRPEVLAVGGTDQLSGDANTLWIAGRDWRCPGRSTTGDALSFSTPARLAVDWHQGWARDSAIVSMPVRPCRRGDFLGTRGT